jgi:hypothetical protein
LISESFEGLVTAATRQNSGRSFAETKMSPPRGPAAGSGVGETNAPGVTVCAMVIVVSGREREERLPQVTATEAGDVSSVKNIAARIASISFIAPLADVSEVRHQDEKELITNIV